MDSASYPLNVTPLSPIETTTKTSSVRANSINIVANKKGGCGKSTVSALLAQHLTGARVLNMDPGQNSLAKFRALGAEKIAVMDGERLNVSVMDNVLEWMLDEPVTFICDVGAPAFESIRQVDNARRCR